MSAFATSCRNHKAPAKMISSIQNRTFASTLLFDEDTHANCSYSHLTFYDCNLANVL